MKHTLELFEITPLDDMRRELGLDSAELIDFCTGRDGSVCMLYSDNPPERIVTKGGSSFVNTKADTRYTAVVLTVDWQNQVHVKTEAFDLGVQAFNYHFLRSIGDDFLLLGARCRYNGGDPERNGLLISRQGKVKRRLCFGDGIQDCLIRQDGTIVTSYFDEGIFGNYGWNDPLGHSGLAVWSTEGEILWQNDRYDICDCYALSVDNGDRLWFYYYTDFNLVGTDLNKYTEYKIPISGSRSFAVSRSQSSLVFDGGYRAHQRFYRFAIIGTRLTKSQETELCLKGKKVSADAYSMLSDRLLFITSEGILCGHEFII